MGFIPDIENICTKLPTTRQTLLFSATMPPPIKKLADKFLSNPKYIEVARPATANVNIEQFLVNVTQMKKRDVLRNLLRTEKVSNAIVFCNRKTTVRELNTSLQRHGFQSGEIHGDIDQASRQKQLEAFKNGEINLLVASDVAARGLDVKGVSHVFNFDAPWHPDDYVHRIGRTGRAGAKGKAFTFVTKADEEAIENIEKLIGNKIERLGKIEAPVEGEERTPAKRGRRAPSAKAIEVRSDTPEAAAEAPEPVREKVVAKPAREKQAPKAEMAKPDQSSGNATSDDDGWNGPMPGFLSVGFGS
jgi:superfamily II DNA/RNA helicase